MKKLRSTRRRGSGINQLRRNLIHSGGVTVLIALLVASGAGVSYAYWTSQATVTSTVQGGQIAVTPNLDTINDFAFESGAFTANGSFTVLNATPTTTAKAMVVTSKLSAVVAPAAQSANLRVAVWQDTIACTVQPTPTGATTGQWDTIGAVSVTLAPGASARFCVRVVDSARTPLTVGGGYTITPTVTSTIKPNAVSGWTASAASTGATTSVPPATGGPLATSTLSCTVPSSNNVAISWGHPAVATYTISRVVNGTPITPPLAVITDNSTQFVLAGSDTGAWPNPNATIRVSDGTNVQDITVKKTGANGNPKLSCD